MLVAQTGPTQTTNQPASAAAIPQNQTFSQQPPESQAPPRHTFPENECSADFWNPYATEALAITQSPGRVQQNYLDSLDPGDRVQELSNAVVDPAEPVQQLNQELVEPAARVQQLNGEVVRERAADRLAPVPAPDLSWPTYEIN